MSCSPAREDFVIDIPPDRPKQSKCSIYRVPKHMRKINKEAYTPKLVSIGPFHHCQRRRELRAMERQKQIYFEDFFRRKTLKKSQKDLASIIEAKEEEIRHCYSDGCQLNSKEFINMILLDAIFIIELFLKVSDNDKEETKEENKDDILRMPWLGKGILRDLILLENQLPFFVLEDLYTSAFSDYQEGQQIKEHKGDNQKNEDTPFLALSRHYFDWYGPQRESIDEEVTTKPIGEEVKHFTDLLRYLLCPPNMEQYWTRKMERWTSDEKRLHLSKKAKKRNSATQFCATKLDDAGLKFKVKYSRRRLLGITFPGCLRRFPLFGSSCVFACLPCVISSICFPSLTCLLGCFGFPMHIFKVPQLVIDHDTEAIFRNLMALEQCYYPSKTYICDYVFLWVGLIHTEKDVDLLVDNKVIANHLGSSAEVAILINKLRYQIVVTTSSYFDHISEKLHEHCEFPLNHFLATLRKEYFANIFSSTATVFGFFWLGFTFFAA
ncbi:UPF0481 protein At3g47200-like [Corylus avellana]|uniref:UPF0481 protein At3g47200-like n=1 Tax=Corylus avellana TaxID=13451 RepID=UPI00286B1B1B|nr:UPF0481 protein At3g47200-like [Corylus avellana]